MLIVSFVVQKLLSLIRSHLFIFELNLKNKLKGTFFLNLLASEEEIVIQKSVTESTKQTDKHEGCSDEFKRLSLIKY